MTGSNSNFGLSDATAREALRERCLSLVRRWQPLARSGWDHQAARLLGEEIDQIAQQVGIPHDSIVRAAAGLNHVLLEATGEPLGEEIDQIAQTSEGLGLSVVNESALELAAYLCSFIDDKLVPNENALDCLAGMVNTLGSALSELSGSTTADVHALHGSEIENDVVLDPAITSVESTLATADAPPAPTWLPRAVCMLGETVRNAPGLAAALRERDYQVNDFFDIDALLSFLSVARPGALLLDARSLSQLVRIRARLDEGDRGGAASRRRPACPLLAAGRPLRDPRPPR